MRSLNRSLLVPAFVLLTSVAAWAQAPDFKDIGRTATPEEVKALDLTVMPSGEGLWPGHGTAKEGAPIYATKCAICHGQDEEGDYGPRLVGGQGTLTSDAPKRPIATMGPFATSTWQVIRRSMPLTPLEPMARRPPDPNPTLDPNGTPVTRAGNLHQFAGEDVLLTTGVNPFLTFDEIYALTAFLLYKSDPTGSGATRPHASSRMSVRRANRCRPAAVRSTG